MSLHMEANLRLLKKQPDGTYFPVPRREISFLDVGDFIFRTEKREYSIGWNTYTTSLLPNDIINYASQGSYEVKAVFPESSEVQEELLAAEKFSKLCHIEDFFVVFDEMHGSGEAGHISYQAGTGDYKLELLAIYFSDDGSDWKEVDKAVLENFNTGVIPEAVYQQITKDAKNYITFSEATSKIYAFAVPAEQVTQEQYAQIAQIAKCSCTEAIHSAAVNVLGGNPALQKKPAGSGDRQISVAEAVCFLKDKKVKESGAFSKGINKGLNIAISALRNEQILPSASHAEPAGKTLTAEDLENICKLAKNFYTGTYEYVQELEDTFSFVSPVEKILTMIIGKDAVKHLQIVQNVREHLNDSDYLEEIFGCYPYGIAAGDVSEEQLEEIATIAGGCGIIEIHEAALQVLGITPSVKEG